MKLVIAPAEYLIDEILGEMVSQQILRYNERDLWVLSLGEMSKFTQNYQLGSSTGWSLPQHLLLDVSRRNRSYQQSQCLSLQSSLRNGRKRKITHG